MRSLFAITSKNFFFILILNIGVFCNIARAEENECKECHIDIFNEISRFPFQHSNIVLNNCKGCHVSGSKASAFNNSTGGSSGQSLLGSGSNFNNRAVRLGFGDSKRDVAFNNKPAKKYSKNKKIKGKRIKLKNYSTEHMVILSNLENEGSYKLTITISDKRGGKNESDTLSFVPSSVSGFLIDTGTPPAITGVMTKRVEIAVITEAEIIWNTDKATDSMIEYGETDDYGDFSHSEVFTRKHKIVLKKLGYNKEYHYRVISVGPFGNKAVSGDHIIDTSKTFDLDSKSMNKRENPRPEFLTTQILRLKQKKKENIPDNIKGSTISNIEENAIINTEGNNLHKLKDEEKIEIAVIFSASKEVTSFIDYYNVKKEDEDLGDLDLEGKHAEEKEETHHSDELKDWREAGIDSCVDFCHRQGASHPVGIKGTRSVRIPKDLPVAEGNIMTCATCHTPHGGELKHLARVNFERDLCVTCHITQL